LIDEAVNPQRAYGQASARIELATSPDGQTSPAAHRWMPSSDR
jgi:hypothetical protein